MPTNPRRSDDDSWPAWANFVLESLKNTGHTVEAIQEKVDEINFKLAGLGNVPDRIRELENALQELRERLAVEEALVKSLNGELRELREFKEDIGNWKSKVIGMATVTGFIAGIVMHFIK